jgi:acyl-CoA thioesterase FadM
MRLRLRLLWLLLASLWREPMSALDESVLTLRVLPNDIDILRITNDRFIALMDLGRMDIAFRVGLIKAMWKRRWVPLATFATIRFRHPLKVFQRYQLRTRIVYWDEDTFYFQQHFERENRRVATGYVCATLLGPDGPVSPDNVLARARWPATRPEKPEIVSQLQALSRMIHEEQTEGRSTSVHGGPGGIGR